MTTFTSPRPVLARIQTKGAAVSRFDLKKLAAWATLVLGTLALAGAAFAATGTFASNLQTGIVFAIAFTLGAAALPFQSVRAPFAILASALFLLPAVQSWLSAWLPAIPDAAQFGGWVWLGLTAVVAIAALLTRLTPSPVDLGDDAQLP